MDIKELAKEEEDYIISMRRLFHENPELSGKEFHTRERLIREIDSMGVPYKLLPGSGTSGVGPRKRPHSPY